MARSARPRRRLRMVVATSLAASALSGVWAAPAAHAVIGSCVPDVLHPGFDLTGDGTREWVVGEPGHGSDSGAVHLLSPFTGGPLTDLRLVQGAAVLRGGARVPGTDEAGDRFGATTAMADFDGDGCDDLAVGAPGEDGGRGAVTILFGGTTGPANRVVTESTFTDETARPGEHFGSVLTVARRFDSPAADLVIGVPDERVTASGSQQGGFVVVRSSQLAAGTARFGQRIVTAASAGVPGSPTNGERFGRALAAGDFDHDTDVDLAVGVPGRNGGRGAVVVFTNTGAGLTSPYTARAFTQDSPGVPGTAEAGDRFGASLAAGFLGGAGVGVAVGSPGENTSAGSVTVLPGSSTGITGTGSISLGQDTAGVEGVAGAGHRFGEVLDIGELEEGFPNFLVVGAPGDVVGGHAGAGSVTLLRSSDDVLALLDGPGYQGVRRTEDSPRFADAAEAGDGFGTSLSAGGSGTSYSLLVGAPGEDLGGVADAGAFYYLDGSGGFGPGADGIRFLQADTPGVVGGHDRGGAFGWALEG